MSNIPETRRPALFSEYSQPMYIDLPRTKDPITYVMSYTKYRYPKWMFWKKTKYYLAAVTKHRVYLIDPDTATITEEKVPYE